MYKQYYGFKERPFKLVPNPHYLFLSKSHEEALGHLKYAVTQGDGFVEITGEVGTGKTTLLRVFLEKLGPDIEAAFIFNPKLNSIQLLKNINDEFGIDSKPDNTKDLIDILNVYLIEKKAEQKKVIILIDEAQNLSIEVLEQLRLLSNLETTQSKLLQIILVGQPELGDKLDSHELRQLGQRITLSCHITPMTFKETREYINHRISIASYRPGVKFTFGAYSLIYQYSNGTPRVINIVCDRALLAGFAQDKKKINRKLVRTAIKELSGRKGYNFASIWLNKKKTPVLLGISLIVFGIAIYSSNFFQWHGNSDTTVSYTEKITPEKTKKTDSPPRVEPIRENKVSQKTSERTGTKHKATSPQNDSKAPSGKETVILEQEEPKTPITTESTPVMPEIAESEPSEPITDQEKEILALEEKTKIAMAIEKELMSTSPDTKDSNKVEGLGDILKDMDSKMSRFLAINTLVEFWDWESSLANYFGNIENDFEFFKRGSEQVGLKVSRVDSDLNLLRTLDIPAIVTLHLPDDPTPRYLTITKLYKNKVVFSLSDRQIKITPEELSSFWNGEAFIIWKDFLNFSEIIPSSATASSILSLKMHLKEIGFDNITINGIYDDTVSDVIKKIQKQNGLTVDGVVGPLTKIVLYNLKDDLSIPHIAR